MGAAAGRGLLRTLLVQLVEPVPIAREHVAALQLERRSQHVVVGSEALGGDQEPTRPSRYDCVVSEHAMPDVDGVELSEALRRRGCTVPVVILSAHVDDTLRAQALCAAALLVLSKYGFEQWACGLLNALERLRRPSHGFIRKVPAQGPPSARSAPLPRAG